METPTKPYDNKRIFWDVDSEKLDYEKKPGLLLNGFLKEAMWKIYGCAGGFTGIKKSLPLY